MRSTRLNIIITIGALLVLVLALAYRYNGKAVISEKINNRIGTTIIFDNDLKFLQVNNQDSIAYQDRPYKILVYKDSVGCTGCDLKLGSWKTFNDLTSKISNQNSCIVLLLDGISEPNARLLAQRHDWDMPILLDHKGVMNKQYHFKDNDFDCMLLDSTNKIVLLGNPIKSEKIHNLYINFLHKNR